MDSYNYLRLLARFLVLYDEAILIIKKFVSYSFRGCTGGVYSSLFNAYEHIHHEGFALILGIFRSSAFAP